MRRIVLAATVLAVAALCAAASAAPEAPVPDPTGVINLQPGYSYTTLVVACTPTHSTESGATVTMPEDFDGNILFSAPGGETYLLNNHELTQPRQGDFQLDGTKCHTDEQRPGDDDSDGWGAVSRLVLDKDGTTVERTELITTGLHNLCAAAQTPWKTFLTNEEFPFLSDPDLRSGWVWEVDPDTGAAKRLTGMGRMSHEQEAYASDGSWYMTDDRGNKAGALGYSFIYKFVPDSRRDLTTGRLYGLAFDRATMTGTWIGPLNPLDPDTDMRSRGIQAEVYGFNKAEGMVATASSSTRGGNAVYFSESGAGADPGRVWTLDHLGNDPFVRGHVVVEGDWGRLNRPDNLRFTDAGDLFLMEDSSAGDFRRHPVAGGLNQVWVLPRQEEGAENLVLFATTPEEPTGPWFSNDNQLMYLSIQSETFPSRVIAIRHPHNYNQPYDH